MKFFFVQDITFKKLDFEHVFAENCLSTRVIGKFSNLINSKNEASYKINFIPRSLLIFARDYCCLSCLELAKFEYNVDELGSKMNALMEQFY